MVITLKELTTKLGRKYSNVRSRDKIDISDWFILPDGVEIDESHVSNFYKLDIPHFKIDFQVNGLEIFKDQKFLKSIYQIGSAVGNSTSMWASFSVDEFEKAKIPIHTAYVLRFDKSMNVFQSQTEENPMGGYNREDLNFQYTDLGNGGPRIEINGSLKYSKSIVDFRKKLGLNGFLVEFEGDEYNKMIEWLPEKFEREIDSSYFIEVPLNHEELKIAEGALGKTLLPDNIPCVQIFTGNNIKHHRTHIKSYFRSVDAEKNPEEVHELMVKGFKMLKGSRVDEKYRTINYDKSKIKSSFDNIFNELKKFSRSDQIKTMDQLLKWYDPEKKYMDKVAIGVDAEYLVLGKDSEILTEWYLTSCNDTLKFEELSNIFYQGNDMPGREYPNVGNIRKLVCSDRFYEDEDDRMGYAVNSVWLKETNHLDDQHQDVWLTVSLNDPKLCSIQQSILDKIGIKIKNHSTE